MTKIFDFLLQDVLKCLLRGLETSRKKYGMVFEKFASQCSKIQKKNQPPLFADFLKIVEVFLEVNLKRFLEGYETKNKKNKVVY